MMKTTSLLAACFLFITNVLAQNDSQKKFQWTLHDGWAMQSSLKVPENGEVISQKLIETLLLRTADDAAKIWYSLDEVLLLCLSLCVSYSRRPDHIRVVEPPLSPSRDLFAHR